MPRILDNIGALAADEFKVAVAMGSIPGWTSFRKFGMNDAVISSTTQEMWPIGTARTLPSAAAVAAVVSSSAGDAAALTGARTVTIEGLDANYAPVSDTVTMNGVTPVNTTVSFFRINRAYVVTAGTGGQNAGNITISVGGNAQAYIEALEGQTHQTHYTVPAGYNLIVTGFSLRVGRMSGSTDLHVLSKIKLYGTDTAWRTISDIYLWNGASHDNSTSITVIPEKTELRQVIKSTTTTQCNAVFSGYLVKKTP